MRTGHADLPLHGGRAPRWLFERMTSLAREVCLAVVAEEGPRGLMRRLSDPVWFQSFGAVLGFDWHSSGVTTTVCGAVKGGLRGTDAGVVVAGGKGRASRGTPAEIVAACERSGQDADRLVRASRLSAEGRFLRGPGRLPGLSLHVHSLRRALSEARTGRTEKLEALRRLGRLERAAT